MVKESANKKDAYWLHMIIMLLFMIGFGYLPTIEPITSIGMRVLGIFIGLLYGWTFLGMTVPSILGLILAGFTGVAGNCKTVLGMAFSNDTFIFILFVLIFVGILNELDVVSFISNWLVTRKSLNGRPWLFSYMILLGTLIMGMVAHPFPAILFFWGVIYKVCDIYQFQKMEKWPSVMIFGVCVAAILSMGTCPYRAYVVMLFGTFSSAANSSISFLQYFLFTLPISLILLGIYILTCKFVFKADVHKISNIDTKQIMSTQKITAEQKIGLTALLAFLIAIFVPTLLPKKWMISAFFNTLGTTGTCVLAVVIFLCIRLDKKFLIDLQRAATRGIQWEIVMLCLCILTFVGYLTNEATGISAFINLYLGGLLAGFKGFSLIALLVALAAICTNFANNIVVGAIFITMACTIAPAAGIHKLDMLSVMIIYGAILGFVTPAASPYAAAAFGNKEWLTSRMIYQYGGTMLLIYIVSFVVLGYVWGNIVF